MGKFNSKPNISGDDLRVAVRKEYANVALDPHKGYHFHTGRDALGIIGYDESLLEGLPEANIASFAGTGNPFMLGPINTGDIVVDIGSGSGLDALIASKLVGPGGRVIGIDMTPEMLSKAQEGVKEMGAANVEFRKGLVEDLPLPDNFADVAISNGVLNLTLNKVDTLREWARILKPGGRIYIGDILVSKTVPESAINDISLRTG
jgi:SAM-dependent methyltransferase